MMNNSNTSLFIVIIIIIIIITNDSRNNYNDSDDGDDFFPISMWKLVLEKRNWKVDLFHLFDLKKWEEARRDRKLPRKAQKAKAQGPKAKSTKKNEKLSTIRIIKSYTYPHPKNLSRHRSKIQKELLTHQWIFDS